MKIALVGPTPKAACFQLKYGFEQLSHEVEVADVVPVTIDLAIGFRHRAEPFHLPAGDCGLLDAFIDFGDRGDVEQNVMNAVGGDRYFKMHRHLLPKALQSTVRDYAMTFWPWMFTGERRRTRTYSVCALYRWKKAHKWDRVQTMHDLRSVGTAAKTCVGPAGVGRFAKEYAEVLENSWMSVVLPGTGWDTWRFWESLAAGAIPVIPAQLAKVMAVRYDGLPRYVFDGTKEDLRKTITGTPPEMLEEDSARAFTLAWERHQPKHRAQYVLEALGCV